MVEHVVACAAPLRTADRPSVLVIDDDNDIREYLDSFLAIEGFEVTTLADPSFAIERIRGQAFDLILLDQMMPKIDGLELLARIRDFDDDIAVIMITGFPTREIASTVILYGVSAYLGHPITPTELREAIANTTHRARR
jgi:DNA-binding response OmpR family regulator